LVTISNTTWRQSPKSHSLNLLLN